LCLGAGGPALRSRSGQKQRRSKAILWRGGSPPSSQYTGLGGVDIEAEKSMEHGEEKVEDKPEMKRAQRRRIVAQEEEDSCSGVREGKE